MRLRKLNEMQQKNSAEEIKDDSSAFLGGLGVGGGVGLIPTVAYHTSTRERKARWDKERVMHHGPIGLILMGISSLGYLSDNPKIRKLASFGVGTGAGITLSDVLDLDKWFREGKIFE